MSRPQSKHVRVDATFPSAAAVCDLCGRWYNLRDLAFDFEWGGNKLYNTGSLRCCECIDIPQEQFRTIILAPDPPPLPNVRVPYFDYEEQTVLIAQTADPFGPPWAAGPQLILCDQTGEIPLLMQYLTQSAPGPAPLPGTDFFVLGQSDLGGGDSLLGPPTSPPSNISQFFKLGQSKTGGTNVLG